MTNKAVNKPIVCNISNRQNSVLIKIPNAGKNGDRLV